MPAVACFKSSRSTTARITGFETGAIDLDFLKLDDPVASAMCLKLHRPMDPERKHFAIVSTAAPPQELKVHLTMSVDLLRVDRARLPTCNGRGPKDPSSDGPERKGGDPRTPARSRKGRGPKDLRRAATQKPTKGKGPENPRRRSLGLVTPRLDWRGRDQSAHYSQTCKGWEALSIHPFSSL